jgi:predicted O-methyltransferase YrrM
MSVLWKQAVRGSAQALHCSVVRRRLRLSLPLWLPTPMVSPAQPDIELIERFCGDWEANAQGYTDALDDLRDAAKRLLPTLPQLPLLPEALRRRLYKIEPAIRCLARQPQFFPEMFHGVTRAGDGFVPLDRGEALHLSAFGLLSLGDCNAIRDICRRLHRRRTGPLRIVEIGSAAGTGSTPIAGEIVQRSRGTLYSVDPWPGLLYRVFLANLQIFELETTVVPFRGTSIDAAALFEDGSLDGVFLDGSHIYEDVLTDIDVYLPKLRKGGILFGHDLHDAPSRFDREELLRIASVNNAMARYWNRRGEADQVDVHPGVILAVQDRFGDDIEHFAGSVVWAKQL